MAETRAGGGREGDELPDGVIPLRPEAKRAPSGCVVTGCLNSVVILFAVLLIALLVGLAVRMWITPSMPRM